MLTAVINKFRPLQWIILWLILCYILYYYSYLCHNHPAVWYQNSGGISYEVLETYIICQMATICPQWRDRCDHRSFINTEYFVPLLQCHYLATLPACTKRCQRTAYSYATSTWRLVKHIVMSDSILWADPAANGTTRSRSPAGRMRSDMVIMEWYHSLADHVPTMTIYRQRWMD